MAQTLPDNWNCSAVDKVATVIMGQSPDSRFVNDDQVGIPFLQGNAEFAEKNPVPIHWVTQPTKLAEKEDILISVRAPVGEINVADIEYCIGRGLAAIRFRKIDNQFGWYAIAYHKDQLGKLAQGSTFTAVSSKDFSNFEIIYPTYIDEQRAIAVILSTLDEAIARSESLVRKYQSIKQGLMSDLLTRGVDENGESREESYDFETTKVGRVPKTWQIYLLGNIASIKYGISDAINPNLRTGVPTINLPAVSIEGELSLVKEALAYTPEERVSKNDVLQHGDLLFNWRNGSREHLGKTAYFDSDERFTHVGFLLRVRVVPELCDSRYLWWRLYFMRKQGYFLRAKSQVNNTFNSKELADVNIALPPLEEQIAIARILDAYNDVILNEIKNVEKLQILKEGLMRDLLSGQVRVSA